MEDTDGRITIAPASLPQEWALNSTSDITLYGGGMRLRLKLC
jgi:hypothetical protein